MKRSGFTLIELLVVIAIIAILAAILFPIMLEVKRRTGTTRCLNNQKQLSAAFRAYMNDYNGRMPKLEPWYATNNTPPPANWCGAVYPLCCWPERGGLFPYIKNRTVYLCASDKGLRALHITGTPRDYPLSYSVNWLLDMVNPDSIVRRQSQVLLLLHEGRDTINDGYLCWANSNDDMPSAVHYQGSTACFMDGHACYLTYNELRRRRQLNQWDPKK